MIIKIKYSNHNSIIITRGKKAFSKKLAKEKQSKARHCAVGQCRAV